MWDFILGFFSQQKYILYSFFKNYTNKLYFNVYSDIWFLSSDARYRSDGILTAGAVWTSGSTRVFMTFLTSVNNFLSSTQPGSPVQTVYGGDILLYKPDGNEMKCIEN